MLAFVSRAELHRTVSHVLCAAPTRVRTPVCCCPDPPASPQAANEVAHSLIREVWEVVDANYLDARSTGFDRDRWAGLRDAALGQSYRDTGGAHRWGRVSLLALVEWSFLDACPTQHMRMAGTSCPAPTSEEPCACTVNVYQHTTQVLVDRTPHHQPLTYPRAIRDMLARGLSDPYCRFVPASELAAMKKYDVSGVGLNLGTAREFEVKTVRGRRLPAGTGLARVLPSVLTLRTLPATP